jgi:hypothetical protein
MERAMRVAEGLIARTRALGLRSLAVVGTSKNAGKSVVVASLIEALARDSKDESFGLCSIGRDGETIDAIESTLKPRFALRAGAYFATAEALVPRSPACEIVALTDERSALGRIAIARARAPVFVEIAGPPSANALRRIVAELEARCAFVVIDGAVDRIAALRGGYDAVVVAVGAASAPTIARAAEDAAALVARLRIARFDPTEASISVEGALTAERAAAFVRAGETRQIVVADATQIALRGRTFFHLGAALRLRCERELHPIACTVAPLWAHGGFEPAAFARAVATATGLPTYDVFFDTRAEPQVA